MMVGKRADEDEDAEAVVEERLLASMERALESAKQQKERARERMETAQRRVDLLSKLLFDAGVVDVDGEADNEVAVEVPSGSMTDGIRLYLQSIGRSSELLKRTATAKEVETWLVRKGYRTGARNFYWSVYGALRASKDVVGVVRQGETTRFALKDVLPRAPEGWRLTDFPRRNTLASRQAQPAATKAKTAKGR